MDSSQQTFEESAVISLMKEQQAERYKKIAFFGVAIR